ncbi:MAG: valine--tRNA ligase [Elusimicrobia bacterium RIFOXYD2_FULL_34_15]|nr:MAG: valine--tRNA ligase [Elusimicrobia bacterium RIFOXYD2_FULL_34_15]
MEISKTYEPIEIEKKWLNFWEEHKLYHSEPNNSKPFTIVIPPPNVTGSLHMGHALNNLLQDIIIRFKRMNGFNSCWVPGTDHGGIATQNVVERILKKAGILRENIGRDKFLEEMWKWRKETGDTILYQLKKLGCSCDWDKTSFTMDDRRSKSVNYAFTKLYEKGLIYRGERIVDWCPRCGTALNESEVEQEDEKGKLWYIKYPIQNESDKLIIVATTRPETMLGDTAVAVNPNDERYKKFIGKNAVLPLVNRIIPIISDEMVDPKFGTGAVKITPAHDRNDAETARRHNLVLIHAIDKEAKITSFIINDLNGQPIKNFEANELIGKDRYEARKILIEKLKEKELLEKEENYVLPITRCYRCDTATEPLISKQWFLKMNGMAKRAMESAKTEETKFFPEKWLKPYLLWLENLKDWCISRQIWWGHQIPLWYCMNCAGEHILGTLDDKAVSIKWMLETLKLTPQQIKEKVKDYEVGNINIDSKGVFASEKQPEKCPQCGKSDFIRDPDVLDTWFSSALWPMSVFGWPEETKELKYYYPTDVLVTGHEILYLWVARMIMMGLEFRNNVPYHDVYIHGIVRDSKGKKMSKSLGNVIDPLGIMEKFGTDALRFALAYQGIPGRDMQISDENFLMARNFANKLWNVSRFVMMNLDQNAVILPPLASLASGGSSAKNLDDLELTDKWILSELNLTIKNVTKAIEDYNPSEASRLLYEFIWSKYCDWYVEFSKTRLYGNDEKTKSTTQKVHIEIIEKILKLLHPIMPFITEEIFQNLKKQSKSIMISDYPKYDESETDKTADEEIREVIEVITAIRNIRSEMNVKQSDLVDIIIKISSDESEKIINENKQYINSLAKVKEIKFSKTSEKPKLSASAIIGNIEIFVLLEGKIDLEKEKKRLESQIHKINQEANVCAAKISNKNFLEKANPEEVERVKQKLQELYDKKKKLEEIVKNLDIK